jgi:tetratricopeptide (TPR) repeat protein
LRLELGEILRDRLNRKEEALERFQQILAEDAGHDAARGAVERMLEDRALRLRAAEILQPIYDGRGDHEKLVGLYELEARVLDDPRERLGRFRKIAELREKKLSDPEGAFEAHARAAREALAEPELKDHLAALERLAGARGRIADLVTLYRELAPQLLDADLRTKLYLDIADLARGKLADVELAREYYRRVLDANPEDPRALTALEGLYRETGEDDALRDVLLRKAELAADDTDARRAALAEIANLTEEKLRRPEEAVAAWSRSSRCCPPIPRPATPWSGSTPPPSAGSIWPSSSSGAWASPRISPRRSICAIGWASCTRSGSPTPTRRSRTTRRRWAAIPSTRRRSRRSSATSTIRRSGSTPPRCWSRSTSRASRGRA